MLSTLTLAVLITGCPLTSTAVDVELVQDDKGKTFSITVGQIVSITLPSNVSTGYAWELDELDADILENTNQRYNSSSSTAPGSGGEEVWQFTARDTGIIVVRLEYRRSWEDDTIDPADVYQVTFKITEEVEEADS